MFVWVILDLGDVVFGVYCDIEVDIVVFCEIC